jgi:hypothetical protein
LKFPKDLVLNDKNGRSLVFDDGAKDKDAIRFNIPIQPQLDEDSPDGKAAIVMA